MSITPEGLLIGFGIAVVLALLVWAAVSWRPQRPPKRGRHLRDEEDIVVDLAYLERAIKADEEAAARRAADKRPLLSQAPDAQPDRRHQLPTDEK